MHMTCEVSTATRQSQGRDLCFFIIVLVLALYDGQLLGKHGDFDTIVPQTCLLTLQGLAWVLEVSEAFPQGWPLPG